MFHRFGDTERGDVTGLATEVIAERYKAGETVAQLAQDYEREEAEIEELVRCELNVAA